MATSSSSSIIKVKGGSQKKVSSSSSTTFNPSRHNPQRSQQYNGRVIRRPPVDRRQNAVPQTDNDLDEEEDDDGHYQEKESQPHRLISFQRRLSRLQHRFGDALQRLAQPTSDISQRAQEERDRKKAFINQLSSYDEEGKAPGLPGQPAARGSAVGSTSHGCRKEKEKKEEEEEDIDIGSNAMEHVTLRGRAGKPHDPAASATATAHRAYRPPSVPPASPDPMAEQLMMGIEDTVKVTKQRASGSPIKPQKQHQKQHQQQQPSTNSVAKGPLVMNDSARLTAELARVRKELEQEKAKLHEVSRRELQLKDELDMQDSSAGLFDALNTIMSGVGSVNSIEALITYVALEFPSLLDVDQARLFLIKQSDRGGRSVLWTLSDPFDHADIVEAPIGTGLVGESALQGILIKSGDRATKEHEAMLCVPIKEQQGSSTPAIIGVIQCIREAEGKDVLSSSSFSRQDEVFVKTTVQVLADKLKSIRQEVRYGELFKPSASSAVEGGSDESLKAPEVQGGSEMMDLHEQVFRQQSELNRLGQLLEQSRGAILAHSMAFEAMERLLTATPDWNDLHRVLPSALSIVLGFDGLEYHVTISSSDVEEDLQVDGEKVVSILEGISSPQARSMAILQQVIASGRVAVRQVQVRGVSAMLLCVPLVVASSTATAASAATSTPHRKRVIGALVLERQGEEACFSEQDIVILTQLAPMISALIKRAAREQMVLNHMRHSSVNQKALYLLTEAEKLWGAAVGGADLVYGAFGEGLINLLSLGGCKNGNQRDVECTLFLLEPMEGVLIAVSSTTPHHHQEPVAVGVGTVGMVAASGGPMREGQSLLCVPIIQDQRDTVLGVVRIRYTNQGRGGGRLRGDEPSSFAATVDLAVDDDLRMVQAFIRVLISVLQHTRNVQSALGGIQDAAAAIRTSQLCLEEAQGEASKETAARARSEELIQAIARLHEDCSRGPDALVYLFGATEDAACTCIGADDAALLLVVDDVEDGPPQSIPDLWTMWPTGDQQQGERCRVRITQHQAVTGLDAVINGVPLIISSPDEARNLSQITIQQSWLFKHSRIRTDAAGDSQSSSQPLSIIAVPIRKPRGGMAGVLEVLKRGELGVDDKEELIALSREVSTILAWYTAELALARLRTDEIGLKKALTGHAQVIEKSTREADQAQGLASLAFELLRTRDRKVAISVFETYLQAVLAAEGGVELQLEAPMNLPVPGQETLEGLEISFDVVPEGKVMCEVSRQGTMLSSILIKGLQLDEASQEDVQSIIARSWAMLVRTLESLEGREVITFSASSWRDVSGRLLQVVDLVAQVFEKQQPKGQQATLNEEMQKKGACKAQSLFPSIMLLQQASVKLLEADSAYLYFAGDAQGPFLDSMVPSTLTSKEEDQGRYISKATEKEAINLWSLKEGEHGPIWKLEEQSLPVQGSAVWQYFKRWVDLEVKLRDVVYPEDHVVGQRQALLPSSQSNEFILDIRQPQGSSSNAIILSVPITLKGFESVLPEGLAGVLVIERTKPSSSIFSQQELDSAAQWSRKLSNLITSLYKGLSTQEAEMRRRRETQLAFLVKRNETARVRRFFHKWHLKTMSQLRSEDIIHRQEADQLRVSQARVLQMLSACIHCLQGLGPGLEEDDADLLLAELELVVRGTLPPALQARKCVLTLLRPEEKGKSKLSDTSSIQAGQEGGIILSKPVFNLFHELIGRLEVLVDTLSDQEIEETDRLLGLLIHFLGGVATLLGELGTSRERHGEASHLVKVFETQVRLYKEAADAAMRCEAMVTSSGTFLLHKCNLAMTLLSNAQDVHGLCRVTANHLPTMLNATSATIYLPLDRQQQVPPPSSSRLGGLYCPVPPQAQSPLIDHASRADVLQRCRMTGLRVSKTFTISNHAAAPSIVSRSKKDELEAAGQITLMAEPFRAEDGDLCGILCLESNSDQNQQMALSSSQHQEERKAREQASKDKTLDWVTATLASAIEGASRTSLLKNDVAQEAWISARYRKLTEATRSLQEKVEGSTSATPVERLVSWMTEQVKEVLDAERVKMFVCDSSSSAAGYDWWTLDDGERRYIERRQSSSTFDRALSLAEQGQGQDLWALPRAALLSYDAGVDVHVGESEVLGVMGIRGGGGGPHVSSPLVGLLQVVLEHKRLMPSALEAVRPVAQELMRCVGNILACHYEDTNDQLLDIRYHTLPSLGRQVSAGGVLLGTSFVHDLLPSLLEVPMKSARIQDLMAAVHVHVQQFLLSSPRPSKRKSSRSRSSQEAATNNHVSVHLFALDQEGLWTIDPTKSGSDGQEEHLITIPAKGSGLLRQVLREKQAQVLQGIPIVGRTATPLVPSHDLVGIDTSSWPVQARISIALLPVMTLVKGAEGTKLRGVLRCVIQGGGTSEAGGSKGGRGSELMTSFHIAVLTAVSQVLAGSITIIDSVLASKALNDLYERADGALARAQTNIERSNERAEKLQNLCRCAILSAFPLWWESSASTTDQVTRVAQLAVQNCSILLGCSKAMLLVAKEGVPHSNSSSRLDAYEWSEALGRPGNAEQQVNPIQRREIPRPTGRGKEAGLLGRCLRKGQLLNISEPLAELRYNPEIDGEDAGPTLLVPLKWPGKAVLGLLRIWREEKADDDDDASGNGAFSQDEEIMAEVYASHVSLALSYAKAADGLSGALSASAAAAAGSKDRTGLLTLDPSPFPPPPIENSLMCLTPPGPRRPPSALASVPSSSIGPVKDISGFFREQSSVESNIEDIRKQLKDIELGTRQVRSSIERSGLSERSPGIAGAIKDDRWKRKGQAVAAVERNGAEGEDVLPAGLCTADLKSMTEAVRRRWFRDGTAEDLRKDGGPILGRGREVWETGDAAEAGASSRMGNNRLEMTALTAAACGGGGGAGEGGGSRSKRKSSSSIGGRKRTSAQGKEKEGVDDTADLSQKIQQMKKENEALSKNLKGFLDESSLSLVAKAGAGIDGVSITSSPAAREAKGGDEKDEDEERGEEKTG